MYLSIFDSISGFFFLSFHHFLSPPLSIYFSMSSSDYVLVYTLYECSLLFLVFTPTLLLSIILAPIPYYLLALLAPQPTLSLSLTIPLCFLLSVFILVFIYFIKHESSILSSFLLVINNFVLSTVFPTCRPRSLPLALPPISLSLFLPHNLPLSRPLSTVLSSPA